VDEIENELVRRQNKKSEGKKVMEKPKKVIKPNLSSAMLEKKIKNL